MYCRFFASPNFKVRVCTRSWPREKKKALFPGQTVVVAQGVCPRWRTARYPADRGQIFRCKFMSKEESCAERWSRKAAEQARQSAAQGETTDERDRFSIQPRFHTVEEGNAWVLEQHGEWYVRKCRVGRCWKFSPRLHGVVPGGASRKRGSGAFGSENGIVTLLPAELETTSCCQTDNPNC